LKRDFTEPNGLAKNILMQDENSYPKIYADTEYDLAMTFLEKNNGIKPTPF